MNWLLLAEIVYVLVIIIVILRVINDTRSSVKALAYILFIIFVPIIGMIFYFSFGINYRKRKLYSKKIVQDAEMRNNLRGRLNAYSQRVADSGLVPRQYDKLTAYIRQAGNSPLTSNNSVKLLINGEEKFPELLKALESAKSHIHIEYYIFENDVTGNSVADILVKKAQEGVQVRFLYDDFGSHGLGKAFIQRLKDAGVEAAPFYKITWYALANRLNYRNHRKIIIIDGEIGFVGGINMSDRYRNDLKSENHLFWRDTHLMIKGRGTAYLQYLFIGDWNFCSTARLEFNKTYFPDQSPQETIENDVVQMVASGPDSVQPVIFYTILEAIASSKRNIYITSPYFIPGESLMDALIIACQSGVDVKILVPGVSDSKMVNAAASAYYTELLQFGAEIYQYNKGFVHAKTMVIDDNLAIIGSANMDYRSFDLNFEVNAMVYSSKIAKQLKHAFAQDLQESVKINPNLWANRSKFVQLREKIVRLLSPFL